MSTALLHLIFAYIFFSTFALGQAQNLTFVEGLVNSLTNLGFGDFGQTLLQINGTAVGQNIITALQNGNVTVFVPTNQACELFTFLPIAVRQEAMPLPFLLFPERGTPEIKGPCPCNVMNPVAFSVHRLLSPAVRRGRDRLMAASMDQRIES